MYLQLISLYAAPRRCLLLLIIYCFSEILVSLYLPTVSVFLGILNLRARSLAWRREFSYFCRGHTGGGGVLGHQYFGRILFYYQVVNFAISYYRSHLHAYIYIYIYVCTHACIYIYLFSHAIGHRVWRIAASDRSRLSAHARWQVATACRTPRPHGYVLKAKYWMSSVPRDYYYSKQCEVCRITCSVLRRYSGYRLAKAIVYVLLVLSGSDWLGATWQVKRGYGRRLQEWYLYIVSVGGLYILEALSVHNYIYISDFKRW